MIAENVVEGGGTGATAALSASAAGPFAYRTGPSTAQHTSYGSTGQEPRRKPSPDPTTS